MMKTNKILYTQFYHKSIFCFSGRVDWEKKNDQRQLSKNKMMETLRYGTRSGSVRGLMDSAESLSKEKRNKLSRNYELGFSIKIAACASDRMEGPTPRPSLPLLYRYQCITN